MIDLNVLSDEARKWIIKYATLVEKDKDFVAPAGTRLTRDGIEIAIRKPIPTGDKLRTLLLHEISHVLRGDLLVKEIRTSDDEGRTVRRKVDPQRWNIAADSQINAHLDYDTVKELDGVTYEDICQSCEDLPKHYLPGAKAVYEALEDKAVSPRGCKLERDDNAGEEAEGEVVSAILGASKELRKEVEIGDLTAIGSKAGSWHDVDIPDPKPVSLPSRVLRAVEKSRGQTRARSRTYSRPGRVKGMRGSALLPKLKVLVAADVSGSCVSYWPTIGGVARYLDRRHNVEVAAWSTKAAIVKTWGKAPNWGGGTDLNCVFELAHKEKPDVLIVVTDGHYNDPQVPRPKGNIVWLMIGDKLPPGRKDGDLIIEITHES